MKKSLIIAIMALACVAFVNAQPRAIGGRLGYGVEFSYEHGLGNNMLSIDAGVPGFAGLEAAVTYDWIDPFGATVPWDHKGEWHWYMGVGAGAGLWGWYNWSSHNFYSNVGVAGRFGIEYDFWFPLQLSLDWRPLVGPGFDTWHDGEGHTQTDVYFHTAGLYMGGIALGVRYKF